MDVERASALIRSDRRLDLSLREHIIDVILYMKGMPDVGHFARTIIGVHRVSDGGSMQEFVEMLVGGINFLRTAEAQPARDTRGLEGNYMYSKIGLITCLC